MKTEILYVQNKPLIGKRPRAFLLLWGRTLVNLTHGAWHSIIRGPRLARQRGPGLLPEQEHEFRVQNLRPWM